MPHPVIEREFIGVDSPTAGRAGAGGHPCQGLYHRAAGHRPKVAMIATHYQIDFSEHYIAEYMASRGVGFLGWNTRFRGFESSFVLDHALVDIGVGVRWLRETAGVETVVLLGNSGGGSLMAAYQAQSGAVDLPSADGYVASAAHPGRPLREIARQPVFIVAVTACSLGYGVMNLLMAATPIAMAQCHHPFSAAALVLEWHVLAMFVPSFFTGKLIKRFGVLPIMTVGLLLNIACVAFALHGNDVMHFLGALMALGVGWNFLFIGGSTLVTTTYTPEEKTRAQGAVDFCVYATMTVTSFSSGALVTTGGWTAMNLGSIVPLALLAVALLWLAQLRRRPALA